MPFNPKKLDHFPTESGVYLMKGAAQEILYIGKAKNLRARLKQYFAIGGDGRAMVPFLTAQVQQIETIIVPTERDALLLENTLIKKHQPKYNAFLKDDKTFISLMINHTHKWPMIRLVRVKGQPKEKALFFGPYTSALAARETLELLRKLFPLRQCSDEELKRRTRPCLLYGIKRCIAPCVGKCDEGEYQTFVEGAIQFLKGENREILKKLKQEMSRAAEELEFEKAAAFQRTIQQIEHVTQERSLVVRLGAKNCDVLSLYRLGNSVTLFQMLFREGRLVGSEHYSFSTVASSDEEILESFLIQNYQREKTLPEEILLPIALPHSALIEEILTTRLLCPHKGDKHALVELASKNAKSTFEQERKQQEVKERALFELMAALKLTRYPEKIACFDTSNISGSDLVAAAALFVNGVRDKSLTRTYKIRGITKPDDYGALHQVLSRYLIKAKESGDLPDLLLIDGGKGQLGVALDVFKELDIASVDLIAIAKEAARHDKGLSQERIFLPQREEPIQLPPTSPLLFLLQHFRDTVHEVAIHFHRKQRKKRTLTSALDEIQGIGAVKKQRLLKRFGSMERIRAASAEELLAVKGITSKDVANLLMS